VAIDPALADRVARLLAEYLDDGESCDPLTAPVAIRAGTALVLVRLVDAEPPVVRVFSPLLRAVERSDALLVELNEINAHLSFVRLFWRDDTVFAATEVLAGSLDAETLGNACDAVAELADHYDVRLHEQHGGELAYG
jgi:hypothetical protein